MVGRGERGDDPHQRQAARQVVDDAGHAAQQGPRRAEREAVAPDGRDPERHRAEGATREAPLEHEDADVVGQPRPVEEDCAGAAQLPRHDDGVAARVEAVGVLGEQARTGPARSPRPCRRRSPPPHTGATRRRWGRPVRRAGGPCPHPSPLRRWCRRAPSRGGRTNPSGRSQGTSRIGPHVRAPRDRRRRRAETPRRPQRPVAHGEDRQPLQAARVRVPVGRDLRGIPLDLRLRAHRGPAVAQREGRLVAVDGPDARRRRRPRCVDPLAAGDLGGVGPPLELHRPAGGLQGVPRAVPRGPARRPPALPELRGRGQLHRGPPVQPDVQDPGRAGRVRRRRGLPATRDGAGHVHQLHERA